MKLLKIFWKKDMISLTETKILWKIEGSERCPSLVDSWRGAFLKMLRLVPVQENRQLLTTRTN